VGGHLFFCVVKTTLTGFFEGREEKENLIGWYMEGQKKVQALFYCRR